MNIRHRFKQFFKGYIISGSILLGLSGIFFVGQGLHYQTHRDRQITYNAGAANRERLWSESTNPAGVKEGGDSVDKLARLLNPILVPALTENTQNKIQAAPLPNEIATASIAPNALPGLTDALNWCLYAGGNANPPCNQSGSFGDEFKTAVVDILSGNIAPYLHQQTPVTYHPWPRVSEPYILLWWLIVSSFATFVGAMTVEETRFEDDKGYTVDVTWPDFPNGLKTDPGYVVPVLLTSPIVFTVTLIQIGPKKVGDMITLRKTKKRIRIHEQELLADHPKPEMLLEAREVLAELLELDPRFRADPEIDHAITLARKTVQDVEAIPEMVRLDEAKIQATELMKRLIPVKEEANDFRVGHKALMAGYSEEMGRVLKGLPAAPKPVSGKVLTPEEAREYVAHRITNNGNGGGGGRNG